MKTEKIQVENRLKNLEKHLQEENPVLLNVVQGFRKLDKVSRRVGLLDAGESYATRVPWWPLVSVLGTFSAGKSTFLNSYLGHPLQRSGNQAVDDKFTVICYSGEEEVHTLPGLALDADPRFPFYQMSYGIESVAAGEGARIDAYLQLKTCHSDVLRGKILIDSPGFDADDQRTATLRITDYIINLSDLVLVFFDARHPEPGAMQDTLTHLVQNTLHRADSNKFMFILNQIDCTAREDNPEEVVAAWQRALSQAGLTAGRFYQIYDDKAANPIEDESLKNRFETKRDADMLEIRSRMQQVEIERAYRVIGVLEQTAHRIVEQAIPKLRDLLKQWKKIVLILDAVVFGLIGVAGLALAMVLFESELNVSAFVEFVRNYPLWKNVALGVALLGGVGYLHFLMRKTGAWWILRKLEKERHEDEIFFEGIRNAFRKSVSRWWRSVFSVNPAGWGQRQHKRVIQVIEDTDAFVQDLNDQFTNPSGKEPSTPSQSTLSDGVK